MPDPIVIPAWFAIAVTLSFASLAVAFVVKAARLRAVRHDLRQAQRLNQAYMHDIARMNAESKPATDWRGTMARRVSRVSEN